MRKKEEGPKQIDLYRVKFVGLGGFAKIYRNGSLLGKVHYYYIEDFCEFMTEKEGRDYVIEYD